MRTSEAHRYARWSATVAGLLLAIVVGIYLRQAWRAGQLAKKAPPAVPATVEQQSADFSYSKVEGHQTVFTVRASRATAYKQDSRNLLEDVSISVYGRKGERNDSLITKACDFISTSGSITCLGEVQIILGPANAKPTDQGVIRVTTSRVTFNRDSGEAVADAPVTFQWPSCEGRAVGINYRASSGLLKLVHDVDLTLSSPIPAGLPAPEGLNDKGVHLQGDSMTFSRNEHFVRVSGMVRAQQESHEISADEMLLDLDLNLHARRLIASGHPQVRDSDSSASLLLDAEEISAELSAGGHVQSVQASGLVHGSRQAAAGMDEIDARHIKVDLLPTRSAPQLLTASGGVTMKSRGSNATDGTRRLDTDALQIHFADAPNSQGTRIESVNTLAPASMVLQSGAGSNKSPAPQVLRMKTHQSNLSFDEANSVRQLVSTGGVEVSRLLGDGPEQKTASRDLTVNFDRGEWTTIDQSGDVRFVQGSRTAQGATAHMDRTGNTVTLAGPAILTDENTRTTSKTAVFTQGANELRADGGVLTSEIGPRNGGITNLTPTPGHISADHLLVDPAKGRAVYSGNARLWQGDSIVEADTIESESVDHTLVARGHVHAVFPSTPWASGGTQSSPKNSNAVPALTQVQGGVLTYSGIESKARIEDHARVMSAEGSIESNLMDLYFTAASAGVAAKQLSRATATGGVTVRQEGRRGTAERADFTASEGKFVLSGGVPTLYDPSGDTTTGRKLTFHFADDTIIIDSAEGSRTVTLHSVEK
jgi:lipopolysaccharide export system protein LptA